MTQRSVATHTLVILVLSCSMVSRAATASTGFVPAIEETDGCPMFASAYMGRKRWAQPYDRFSYPTEKCELRKNSTVQGKRNGRTI
jgi:hypothetical protein